jgi:ubiquinone/menaquinone biosynthesis C-methylase UbiE
MTPNNGVDWGSEIHEQFIRQAKWTESLRSTIYPQVNLRGAKKVLEVGCGTGVITDEIRKRTKAKITAIDIDREMLQTAEENVRNVTFKLENVEKLSMRSNTFDVILCQYLFLWLAEPEKATKEMSRVCKKRGFVVALAEPDYGGWVEYPDFQLGRYHMNHLKREGADPLVGRKLRYLFESAGLDTSLGVIAQTWDKKHLLLNIEEEWKRVYESKIISGEEYKDKIKMEKEAINENKRTIFMPVFYAIGRKR